MNKPNEARSGAAAGPVDQQVRPPAQAWVYHWTEWRGCVTTLRLSECTASEAAAEAAVFGWTPPRWWQWWRANDYPRKAV